MQKKNTFRWAELMTSSVRPAYKYLLLTGCVLNVGTPSLLAEASVAWKDLPPRLEPGHMTAKPCCFLLLI